MHNFFLNYAFYIILECRKQKILLFFNIQGWPTTSHRFAKAFSEERKKILFLIQENNIVMEIMV